MTHDALIRTYRPIPPLRVWRIRRGRDMARWGWECSLCLVGTNCWNGWSYTTDSAWEAAFATALDHLRTAHACPSMRASGEPCDDYCTDCGGKGWIK